VNAAEPFGIDREVRDGFAVISVSGEVDAHAAPALSEALSEVTEPGARIVVDLTDVNFLDSTGLGVFVTALKHLRELDGSLALVITSPRVKKVFTLTGLDALIPLHETLAQALD